MALALNNTGRLICYKTNNSLVIFSKFLINFSVSKSKFGGSLHGIMSKVLDCSLKVSKLELQLHY